MSLATSVEPLSQPRPLAAAGPTARIRDPRLDFFRGLAMFIILIAHIPLNPWSLWIPARFGFSDATEIFVFCSGMASAIAFGKVFTERGLHLGTARVAFRCWQVYWAHIGLFVAIFAAVSAINLYSGLEKDYVRGLNLQRFADDPETLIVGLMTLTYVPNYFDILPMYLGVLAMMPIVVALAQRSVWLAAAVLLIVYMLGRIEVLHFPAEPWSDREWFFNPFTWQLIFFTGFGFMMGWIPRPPVRPALVWGAVALVILSVILSHRWFYNNWDWVWAVRDVILPWSDKTDFGPIRYLHFLLLAYVCWVAVGEGGRRLTVEGTGPAARIWQVTLQLILKVGQQSLAVFIFSMFIARILGVVLDITGREPLPVALVNVAGMAMLVGVAYGAGWFKSHPWRAPRR